MHHASRSMQAVLGAVVALSALAAGCSSASSSSQTTAGSSPAAAPSTAASSAGSASASGSAQSLLPASIREKGYITDASSFDYPPWDLAAANGGYEGIE